jgi:hypothetical protein
VPEVSRKTIDLEGLDELISLVDLYRLLHTSS